MVTDIGTKSEVVRKLSSLQTEFLANSVGQIHLPSRSKSQPLRDTRMSGHRGRNAEAFDPAELCRRLEGLRRELRNSHRRRREHAEQRAKPGTYHHTPQVAARAFASTTTPQTLKDKDVHKLSRSVLKRYKLGPEYKTPTSDGLQHEPGNTGHSIHFLAERNQFQRTAALESAARTDRARQVHQMRPQDLHSFSMSLNHHAGVFQSSRLEGTNPEDLSNHHTVVSKFITHNPDDRTDWTQKDDCKENDKRVSKYLTGPLFRCRLKSDTADKATYDINTNLMAEGFQSNRASRRRFSFFS